MQICLNGVLSLAELGAMQSVLSDPSLFEPGAATAGSAARHHKHNLQARPGLPLTKGLEEKVRQVLLAHPVFASAALPEQFARILFSCCEPGMGYGLHFDEPIIEGVRTDLSFTLFLSEPESYAGGALLLSGPAGDESIKLSAGDLVLYPSTSLHAVEPVTRGRRIACVGWLQSRVRSGERRALLFEFASALATLSDSESSAALKLSNTRNQLLRMWLDT